MRSKVFHPESGLAEAANALLAGVTWLAGVVGRALVLVRAFRWLLRRLPCFLSIASPLAETFAESRGTDRNSGGFQFLDQLAAAPSIAMERQQTVAQRLQRIGNGGSTFLGRLLLLQLVSSFFSRAV